MQHSDRLEVRDLIQLGQHRLLSCQGCGFVVCFLLLSLLLDLREEGGLEGGGGEGWGGVEAGGMEKRAVGRGGGV